MSKAIKQMQMDAVRDTFRDVRDMVVLTVNGLNATNDNLLRSNLRKKKVRLQMVKNTFTRRVFKELGVKVADESPYWVGTTVLAWGAGSVSELSRAIDDELKAPKTAPLYKDKVKVKGAIADGQEVGFDVALRMPTRQEAIARVVSLALAPASRLLGQIKGPAAQVMGQVRTIAEKTEGEPAAAPA
jgi:large subunit ribosomal protein L10